MKFLKKYSLVIFCFLIAITIFTVSKIEAASIGNISAGDNFNVDSQAGTCTVPLGSNQCVVQVNWNVWTPGQNVLITKISSSGTADIVSGSVAGPYLYTASYTESPVKFILYNNNNGEYSAETSISLSCASGSYWNSSQGKCVASPNGDLYGYPTYTGSTCTVAQGQTTCNVGMAWQTDNPLYAVNSAITTQGATVGSSVTVKTANSGNTTYPLTAGEKRTFYLYHNGVLLDQQEFSAVEGPRVTISLIEVKDGGSSEILVSEGNFTKKVEGVLKSFFGLRSASPVPVLTPMRIYWEAKGDFDINTIECTMPDGITKVKNAKYGYYPSPTTTISSPSSTTTYSITCKDGQTGSTTPVSVVPKISNIQTSHTTDQYGNACDIYDAGRCFYDPSDDVNHVVITWETENLDTCSDTTNTGTVISSLGSQAGKKLWSWDGNNNDDISGTNNITCTRYSTSENKSFSFTFDDCQNYEAETGQNVCPFL